MFKKSIGWIGLVCLQFNAVPLIVGAASGTAIAIQTPLLTIIGLCCYLYHSIIRHDVLYCAGNFLGIVSNSILIYFLLR